MQSYFLNKNCTLKIDTFLPKGFSLIELNSPNNAIALYQTLLNSDITDLRYSLVSKLMIAKKIVCSYKKNLYNFFSESDKKILRMTNFSEDAFFKKY